MTRLPAPSVAALLVLLVYIWRSWLLTLSPVSNCHLPPSTAPPAAPLNSSANVVAMAPTSCATAAGAPLAGVDTATAPRVISRAAPSSPAVRARRRGPRVDIADHLSGRVAARRRTTDRRSSGGISGKWSEPPGVIGTLPVRFV